MSSPKLSLHALVRKKKKKKMLQSEMGNNHCRTRVMSYQKHVGLAADSHLHSLVRTFCQHFPENPLFIFNKILAIIMYIPPTFPFSFTIKIGYYHIYSSYLSCSDAFATTIINIWP